MGSLSAATMTEIRRVLVDRFTALHHPMDVPNFTSNKQLGIRGKEDESRDESEESR